MSPRMGMRVWTGSRGALMGALLVALALGGGCRSSIVTSTAVYRYFVQPAPDDLWSRKIRGWQERERADQPAPAPVAKSGAHATPAAFPPTVGECLSGGGGSDRLLRAYRRIGVQ